MHVKRTNLCVSADVNTTTELLQVAEDVGDHICVLKTHADIIDDFGDKTIRGLNEIARRKKFLVFEDRKFGDIGSKAYCSLRRLCHTLSTCRYFAAAIHARATGYSAMGVHCERSALSGPGCHHGACRGGTESDHRAQHVRAD